MSDKLFGIDVAKGVDANATLEQDVQQSNVVRRDRQHGNKQAAVAPSMAVEHVNAQQTAHRVDAAADVPVASRSVDELHDLTHVLFDEHNNERGGV